MTIRQKLLSLFLGVLFIAATNAQDGPIRVEPDLVTVNVTIKDKEGKAVNGLRQEQFEIFDNKMKQQISHFSGEGSFVTFGIVYDMHPTTEDRTIAVLESLRAFTEDLREGDDFFIVAFNGRGNVDLDFIPSSEQIEGNLKIGQPNSLYDAIYVAAGKLRSGKNPKRVILIITDSSDRNSRRTFAELRNKLETLDLQIYAVIFEESRMLTYTDLTPGNGERRRRISGDASRFDRTALFGLTIRSGGTTHYPSTDSERNLYRIYSQIAAETREFYTLGFYPRSTPDGKWHNLRIGLRSVSGSKRFALTYRHGYQSQRVGEVVK